MNSRETNAADPNQSHPTNVSIRQGTPGDTVLIWELVRELAEYERLLHEMKATPSDFQDYLFGERKMAEVVIAEENGIPVGFALFFQNFSTFLGRPGIHLEDLFVRPSYRGRGYGKALLGHLGKLALERNCGRVEWTVLDWNQSAIDFYHAIGARQLKDWIINRVEGEGIEALARL